MKENKGGRPTEYSKEILEKTREYIDSCEDEQIQLVKQSNEEKGYEMYENKLKVKLPSIEGLSLFLKVSRQRIYDWEDKFDEFRDIIEELRAKQAKVLLENGLSGDYNPTITKVILTKHGYREGIENTGKDGKDLIPEQLNKEEIDKLKQLL